MDKNLKDYEIYHVEETECGRVAIMLVRPDGSKEHIFGMPKEQTAFLDYWAMRLNRAAIEGWATAKGITFKPDDSYYAKINRLFKMIWG